MKEEKEAEGGAGAPRPLADGDRWTPAAPLCRDCSEGRHAGPHHAMRAGSCSCGRCAHGVVNLENEIAATYAEYFLLKHGHTLAEDFGMAPSDTEGLALKAVETWRGLAGVGDEDCSKDEAILAHLRKAVAALRVP